MPVVIWKQPLGTAALSAALLFAAPSAFAAEPAKPAPAAQNAPAAQDAPPATNAEDAKSTPGKAPDDGWPDASSFLDDKYGFLPIAMPITEPAVGYGVAGGLMFLSKPFGDAAKGLGRPNITFVGGLGTANGTWGVVAMDMRYWLDDRIQTLVGFVYASVNLDFHGIGKDSLFENSPLRYALNPKGGMANIRYRFGDTRLWGGLGYTFARIDVTADAPEELSRLPDYEQATNVGGLTLAATYDTRDNFFTATRGFYAEASFSPYGEWLGGDENFERGSVTTIQYVAFPYNLYLGVRDDVQAAFGDAPFYMKPYISLRGVPIMRYQGDELAQIEAELRWQFYGRLSILGFAGGGVAWNDFGWGNDTTSVVSGGGGFRYELARSYGIHAGVDVAVSRDTAAFYIQVGSAWMRP